MSIVLALHKASFIVWIGAAGAHVLAHVTKLPRVLRARAPGAAARIGLAAGTLASGALLATFWLPAADRLQDRATSSSASTPLGPS